MGSYVSVLTISSSSVPTFPMRLIFLGMYDSWKFYIDRYHVNICDVSDKVVLWYCYISHITGPSFPVGKPNNLRVPNACITLFHLLTEPDRMCRSLQPAV